MLVNFTEQDKKTLRELLGPDVNLEFLGPRVDLRFGEYSAHALKQSVRNVCFYAIARDVECVAKSLTLRDLAADLFGVARGSM